MDAVLMDGLDVVVYLVWEGMGVYLGVEGVYLGVEERNRTFWEQH